MTPTERFTLLMVLLTAVLAGVGWLIRLLLAGLVKWTRTEDKLVSVVEDLHELVVRKDQAHAAINERLTYLERSELDAWRRTAASYTRSPHPDGHGA